MPKSYEQVVTLTKETTSFTWKIENFFTVGLITEFIESPPIKCSDTVVRLRLYPEEKSLNKKVVKVTLNEISSSEQDFMCTFGFINRAGHWFRCDTCIKRCISKNSSKTGTESRNEIAEVFISCLSLKDEHKELVPDDVLTVLCKLDVLSFIPDDVTETACKSGNVLLATDVKNLLVDPLLSDVTIRVGEEEFPAHKVILASRSKVFRAMFESGMKESQENTVDLVEIKNSTARHLLEYIYTGSLGQVPMVEAFDLYIAADQYDLPQLKGWCKEIILRNISADHVCEVAVFANLHSDKELARASCRALKNNLQQILKTEKWRDFAKQNPDLYSELIEKAALM